MMRFSDLKSGSAIFIDANIFVYHFSKNSSFNAACTEFLVRIEDGDINGITSTVVVQEVLHRMMMLEAATTLPNLKSNELLKYLKAHPDAVKNLTIHQQIPASIFSFNLEIVSVDMHHIENSQQMKKRYGLLSNDALNLQIMESLKISNIASNDLDFEHVDFIKLFRP